MRVRHSVRLLLLDPQNRLLLIKSGSLGAPELPAQFWATAGGGIEEDETLEQAARREAFEETGLRDVAIGPAVWTIDFTLSFPGEQTTLFRNTFVVAHSAGGAFDNSGWTQQEQDSILELRWWSLAELRATVERVYPDGLAGLLEPILRGEYPPEPIVLPPG
jgi:8-oxo-dGTP pyrophosphatase MutT (NUDIX family)